MFSLKEIYAFHLFFFFQYPLFSLLFSMEGRFQDKSPLFSIRFSPVYNCSNRCLGGLPGPEVSLTRVFLLLWFLKFSLRVMVLRLSAPPPVAGTRGSDSRIFAPRQIPYPLGSVDVSYNPVKRLLVFSDASRCLALPQPFFLPSTLGPLFHPIVVPK